MKIKLLTLMTTLAVSMSVSQANEVEKVNDVKVKEIIAEKADVQNDGAVMVDTTPNDKKGEVFKSYEEFLKKEP